MMVGNSELINRYPQIGKAFEEYTRIRIASIATNIPMGGGMMRVIPIESAISGDSKSASFEQISHYLDKYDTYSVSACSCRRSRRILGQGCGHLEEDMCVQMGKGAEYYIRTGRARKVTREEVEDILRKAEQNGLMHQMPNIEEVGETVAICNCCNCSCFAMRAATMFGANDAIRSNYVSSVDVDKCVACGQCVENCPTNALKLGQKLCAKTPVDKKKEITMRDHIWKEENWNVDYRENREDVAEEGTSPCKSECPSHIAVQGYIKLASQGKYTDALELIKKENPFPAVCGRICPRACESACTRGDIDSPIAIDEIKKFIADKDLSESHRYIPQKRHDYGKKIAVVGAGPAGLSCAYYLAIDGYKVTVFEKEKTPGGMLTLGIPSFRLSKDVVNAEISILKDMGVEFRTSVEVGKDVSLKQLRQKGFKGFYLAIGAQEGRKLGIEGEDASGVITGVALLKQINLGESVSLSGQVIVVGGGNVAIDVARSAIRQGAKEVHMYCLESRKEMPSLKEEIEEAIEEGVVLHNGWGPKTIVTEGGKVKGVEFLRCLSVFDEYGEFKPKYDQSFGQVVRADYVLISVGQLVEWGGLLEGSCVEIRGGGTAKANELTYQTQEPDIFVGGDVFTGPKFAIDAIAAGKEAAISLHRFVNEGQSLTYGRDKREYRSINKKNVVVESFDKTPRQRAGHNIEHSKSYKDERMTFTEEQMKKETERCLGCGVVQVDQYKCVGCGQCTTKCNFEAITLNKKYNKTGTAFEKLPFAVAKHVVQRTGRIVKTSVKNVFAAK